MISLKIKSGFFGGDGVLRSMLVSNWLSVDGLSKIAPEKLKILISKLS